MPELSAVALLQKGLAALNADRPTEAEAAFRDVLKGNPKNVDALHLSGLAAMRLGRPSDAVDAIGRAVALKPGEASFRSNLGVALKAAGRVDEAIAAFHETIRNTPNHVQAYVNLANTLREQDRRAEARDTYMQALEIVADAPTILNNLGNVERELGNYDDAIATYRQAVKVAPNYVEALNNLGSAETARGNFSDAVETLTMAAELQPQSGMIQVNLGAALGFLHRLADAETAFRNAVRLMPDFPEAHSGLGDILMRRGLIDEAISAFEDALTLKPSLWSTRSPLLFIFNYLPDKDALTIKQQAHLFGDSLPRREPTRSHANVVDPERRLRIGLMSGDFRAHAVMQFLQRVLPKVDQSRYELVAYATSLHQDAVTDQVKTTIGEWHDVTLLRDRACADKIAKDHIDILCDLSGHTKHGRLPVFALKPAPIQISWLGYSGTTGLDEIDYVLADRHVVPHGEEDQLVEAPWRMPDSYLCFSPPDKDVPIGPLPALANGHVTFGSFNNIAKLSDPAVELWARVLDAVPGSRLLLKTASLDEPDTAAAVLGRFAAEGVSADRITLLGRLADSAAHLATYNQVDIGLDPFPYNGTTTTAEALWMGVPVLTLAGDRFIAHVGESMLTSAGMPEWIAADTDDYVRKAVAFAADLDALAATRANLRAQMVASPLCDAPRFARNLEEAFRGMWRIWCEKQRSPV